MKLVRKVSSGFQTEKLSVQLNVTPCQESSWHYHPQYELLYINSSTGMRFVGDHVARFSPGELVLVGPNLPHLWRNEDQNEKIHTVIIKFLDNFLGNGTFDDPRFSEIKTMLSRSRYGLSFAKKTAKGLHQRLADIVNLDPVGQALSLMQILHELSQSNHQKQLSSTDMRQGVSGVGDRIDAVLKFISDNYSQEIALADIARIACMTPNSFCRFFKRKTGKSFTQFLTEVRIRNASRLLVQENLSVSEVCHRVGYKSMTNFYRQFKLTMGCTPKSYREAI